MKIVAIVASARKTGNSEILAKEILAAMPASAEKRLIRLADLNIEPCRACYTCLPEGCHCVIEDDFAQLLWEIKAATAVIIASPVYFLGMHTRLKLVCDRLIAVLNEAAEYAGKRCILAIPYGVEGWMGYGVEATISVARFLHLDVVGVLPVHAANPGEAARPEVLAKARALAARLLAEQEPPGRTVDVSQTESDGDLHCPSCGGGVLRVGVSGKVRCGLCNAQGALKLKDGILQGCDWLESRPARFSPAGMREHGEKLEAIKTEFLARRHELAAARAPYRKLAW